MNFSSSLKDGLAPYACHPDLSRGRLFKEPESGHRSVFQRDRDRIIHSAAFRRLEYKTQVFVNHEGDHYRTRLTHSLEVAQLARAICRALRLDEDLAEALALAHDLGHTPFGHAGEDGLCEAMLPFGGFDHNAQGIRILTHLEQKYASFDGLNLTWDALEGIAKHNGPLLPGKKPVPAAILEYQQKQDLELNTYASLEAQIAALSDDIAYNNHDLEDGIRAGFFNFEEIAELPLLKDILAELDAAYGKLEPHRRLHEMGRRSIDRMVADLLAQSRKLIDESGVKSCDEVRHAGKPLIAFSSEMESSIREIKSFLMRRMYRHYKVNRMASKARRLVKDLFAFFHAEPECLPTRWQEQCDGAGNQGTARVVADFIAGMTDRFAIEEYKRLFDMSSRH